MVGQVARDLVLKVEEIPDEGGSTEVLERLELLGGAANQAVGARQLGWSSALVGVVGDDGAGRAVLASAREDGLDVTGVGVRAGGTTALYVDVVESGGVRRLLEHVPEDVLLTPADVRAAEPVLSAARAVLVELRQPGDAVRDAMGAAARGGALVLVDGHPEDSRVRDAVLSSATVVRADDAEAAALAGRELDDVRDAVAAARDLVSRGPAIVALAVGSEGNVVAWDGGHAVLPLLGGAPVDPTGGGDAFVVGLVTALLRGADPETAGWEASAAAALTVGRLGGRPELDADRVAAVAQAGRREAARPS